MRRFKLLLVTLLFSSFCLASTWELNNSESYLHFNSTKNVMTPATAPAVAPITEENTFKVLTGTVDEKGNAVLKIDLNSVDTRIGIRDERMKSKLFQTDQYPEAVFTTQLDLNSLNDVNEIPRNVPLKGQLELHGVKHEITTQVSVTKLDDTSVEVKNIQAVMINAADYNLTPGVNELMSLANLQNISLEVPVNFVLVFVQNQSP